jgi:endoglycosylceramidase
MSHDSIDPCISSSIRFFHGVNVVYKQRPFIPSRTPGDPFNSDADLDQLAAWGFNMMRLGVMWPGVEPSEANYNHTYLDGMQELVGAAGERGIVSLLDFHVRLIVLYVPSRVQPKQFDR